MTKGRETFSKTFWTGYTIALSWASYADHTGDAYSTKGLMKVTSALTNMSTCLLRKLCKIKLACALALAQIMLQ